MINKSFNLLSIQHVAYSASATKFASTAVLHYIRQNNSRLAVCTLHKISNVLCLHFRNLSA